MKMVRVEDAIGLVLAHDLTKIVPGKYKGAAFKKGYIVKEEDIQELKDMGKNHLYIIELKEDEIHEDDAALRIGQAIMGDSLYMEGPSEGKISLKSSQRGLLKVDVEGLSAINEIEFIIVATMHDNSLVETGQTVAGTRIIPLKIEKDKIDKVEEICKLAGNIINIKPIMDLKIGIVVTGTEVFCGRITDKFGPILEEKVHKYGGRLMGVKKSPDEVSFITDAIDAFIKEGADVILTSGGMSVDADDVTPTAITAVADEVISYGSPVLPGAMFMIAYKGNVAILGVPACGMYHRTTILDLILPRVLAGEKITKRDIVSLGHGGLCLNCTVCSYPVCPFGK